MSNPLQNKRKLTLTAVFAALYTVGSFLPGFPVIGSSGSTIPLVRGFEMMYGIILGPFFGPLAAFMGSFIGRFLTGGSLLLSPLAPVSAFMAATIGRKDLGENGWRIGAGIFSFLILIYYFTETGRQAYYYPVLHVLSFLMLIIFGNRIRGFLESSERKSIAIGIALVSLPSTMAGHILGSIIFIIIFKTPALVFLGILPVTIFERLTITVISTLVATPILMTVKNQYPDIYN